MARPLRALLALPLALAPTGCCWLGETLTALSCGKREQPFAIRSYRLPDESLRTFLGAIARDDADTLYESLSPGFHERWGVGKGEWPTLWRVIKGQVTAIHALDRARVTRRERPAPDRAWVELNYAGYRLRVDLRRLAFVTCEYEETTAEGRPRMVAAGSYLPGGYQKVVRILHQDGDTKAVIQHPGVEFAELEAGEIQLLAVGREWKIDGFRMLED